MQMPLIRHEVGLPIFIALAKSSGKKFTLGKLTMYVFYEMGDCKNYEFFPSIRDVCPETRHVNVSWVV